MVKYHKFSFSFLVFPAMFSMLKYGIYKNTPISIRWLIKNHISFWGCSTRSHFFKLYILAKSLPFDTVLPRFFPEKSTNLAGVCYFICTGIRRYIHGGFQKSVTCLEHHHRLSLYHVYLLSLKKLSILIVLFLLPLLLSSFQTQAVCSFLREIVQTSSRNWPKLKQLQRDYSEVEMKKMQQFQWVEIARDKCWSSKYTLFKRATSRIFSKIKS